MEGKAPLFFRLANVARFVFWVLLVGILLFNLRPSPSLEGKRNELLEAIQSSRGSRVITMIHRQETTSVLGVPVNTHIDIDDAEAILRAIRLTPAEKPIDLIVHTPGGLVLAASQIARALQGHKGKVTVFIPHYAMSGGTLLALAADEIVMDPNAVLGPVDPQIGDLPAASIVRAVETKGTEKVSDQTLILADISAKAINQVASQVAGLLSKNLPKEKAQSLAALISTGQFTHDFPITVELARSVGLLIKTEMPQAIYKLMDFYPQNGERRPSVTYVPLKRQPASGAQTTD